MEEIVIIHMAGKYNLSVSVKKDLQGTIVKVSNRLILFCITLIYCIMHNKGLMCVFRINERDNPIIFKLFWITEFENCVSIISSKFPCLEYPYFEMIQKL